MADEHSPSPEMAESNPAPAEPVEPEADTTGGFREPHPEAPADFASHEAEPLETTEAESAPESHPEPEPEPVRAAAPSRESRDPRREPRPERRPEPPRQKQWVKPADFRPAAPTAITQAVEHATFIAEALKELHDQMDEILELVELAERQKLADERELDELRRALRRIQPQRRDPQPPHHQPQQQRQQPRREEPRRQAPEKREQPENREPAERPADPSPKPHTAAEVEELPPHSD